jgi:hypothetical protein
MRLQFQRFQGLDPCPDRKGERGCRGFVEADDNKYECPFQESLEKMKKIFDETNRRGMNSAIDAKYGFLGMYTLDHDSVVNKTLDFRNATHWASPEKIKALVKEMDGATMRCHSCHRFKSILCGDYRINIPTVFITCLSLKKTTWKIQL